MPFLLVPKRFTVQPRYAAPLDKAHQRGGVFVGSVPVELVGKKSRSESDLTDGYRPCGKVRVAGDNTTSDTYPVNVSALTDFTLYLYTSFTDAATPFQYLLGFSSGSGDLLGIPAVHSSIGLRWGLLIGAGGTNTFLDSNEVFPRDQLTAVVITRNGSTIKFFRDGVLKNTVTNSTTVPAMSGMTLNSYTQNGDAGAHLGTYFALAGVDPVAWSDGEVRKFSANPWSTFQAPPRRLWVIPSSSVSGTVSYTNANDTLAASGTTTVKGALAKTNANDTSAASGTTTVTGTLARTNANDSISASGSVGAAVSGTLAYTNANDTSSASGTTTVTGSLDRTNANDSVSASGSIGSAVSGTLAYTNANDTLAAAATTTVTGSLSRTNANDTSAASGTTTIKGSLARTNANDTLAASGTTKVISSLAKTNANDTSAASGTTTIVGALAKTNANDTVAASGTVTTGSSGTVAYTNNNDTLSASGTTKILGTLARTNANDGLAASGTVNNGIIVESALTDGITATVRIKKPGIPAGTPDWLKTTLEIVLGRRGNRVTPPPAQTLTFSSTPTKAECEALYAHVNNVHSALTDLINRFDT